MCVCVCACVLAYACACVWETILNKWTVIVQGCITLGDAVVLIIPLLQFKKANSSWRIKSKHPKLISAFAYKIFMFQQKANLYLTFPPGLLCFWFHKTVFGKFFSLGELKELMLFKYLTHFLCFLSSNDWLCRPAAQAPWDHEPQADPLVTHYKEGCGVTGQTVRCSLSHLPFCRNNETALAPFSHISTASKVRCQIRVDLQF